MDEAEESTGSAPPSGTDDTLGLASGTNTVIGGTTAVGGSLGGNGSSLPYSGLPSAVADAFRWSEYVDHYLTSSDVSTRLLHAKYYEMCTIIE